MLIVVGGASFAFDSILSLFGVEFGIWGSRDPFMQRGSVNFLVVGVDEFNLADLIIVAQYDFRSGDLTALQIPRDTFVETTRWDSKINSAFSLRGIDELKSDITQITGLEIDRYVIVGLRGFREIIDAIGGVEVDVPIRMFYTDPTPGHQLRIDLQPGLQTLSGAQAEGFIRFRKNNNGTGYPDGDLGRLRAQQQFYNALLNQIISLRGVLQAPTLLGIVQENVRTDLTGDEMFRYLGIALRAEMENFDVMQLPGAPGYVRGISYFIHNSTETEQLIYTYFAPSPAHHNRQVAASNVRINRNINSVIRVEVVDATGVELYGMSIGETVAELLRYNAFDVVSVRTLAEPHERSVLIDRNNMQASVEVLKILPGLDVWHEVDRSLGYDISVVVGMDFSH